MEKRVEYLAV